MSHSSLYASSVFLPERPLLMTHIMVRPVGDSVTEPKPIEYYINGLVRHREKLSGMAGDRHRNKPCACVQ